MTALAPTIDLSRPQVLPARPPRARWGFTLVFLLVVMSLLGRGVYLVRPLDNDGAIFIYMGKLASQGAPYWQEFRDNKLPSVGLVMSGLYRVLGINWLGYVLAGLGMSVTSAWVLARAIHRHVSVESAWPTFVFALAYLNLNILVFAGFELETMQSFLCVLAFGAGLEAIFGGRRIDSFVVGLVAGFAAWLKPTGLGVAGVIWLGLMLREMAGQAPQDASDGRAARLRACVAHTLAMLGGALIPIGALFFQLWWTRLLPLMPEIIQETKRYAVETPWKWTDLLKPCVVAVVLGFPIAVRGWVMRRKAMPPAKGFPQGNRLWVLGLALLWFFIEMLGAFLQRRMYSYHFYPVAAPAAIVFGCFARKDTPARLLAMVVPVMVLSVLGMKEVLAYWEPPVDPATEYVLNHTNPGDRIWADCGARLALETDRPLGSRFALMFLLSNYDDAPAKYGSILIDDLRQRRPKIILMPSNLPQRLKGEFDGWDQLRRSATRRKNYAAAWYRLDGFVRANYRLVGWTQSERIYQLPPAAMKQ